MGLATLVERPSSHPAFQARLLDEEAAAWGLPPISDQVLRRRAEAELLQADAIVIPPGFAADSLVEAGIARDRLVQLPFGVDLQRFHPPA